MNTDILNQNIKRVTVGDADRVMYMIYDDQGNHVATTDNIDQAQIKLADVRRRADTIQNRL